MSKLGDWSKSKLNGPTATRTQGAASRSRPTVVTLGKSVKIPPDHALIYFTTAGVV